ncbi:MAG TPA: feruloyl-CoA synthase [Arenicellales bacterium]|nr:feruloyl-CoA synthase [Arenicellales bacterium]MDP7220747.1 feruloyl-CoA synthase [Arenicellales bacterium]HCF72335.1 feruloyl-CoA synthase [Gammaproteobacteria bacterium]HJP09467.1 feruloyl-CoA synthase [Arenicellales bacterium]
MADLQLAPARVTVRKITGGGLVIESPVTLGRYETQVGQMLRHWAAQTPLSPFLVERDNDGRWVRLCYAEAADRADSVSQALLDRNLSLERPVMVLSGNSIEHALLSLGAMQVGIPVVPVSPAYSLLSGDHQRLKALFELCSPGLVYVSDSGPFGPALAALPLAGAELVTGTNSGAGPSATAFSDLLATPAEGAVNRAFDAVGPETVAKILFTSGSTGVCKGVINTHRMLCSNQKSLALVWPFIEKVRPLLLDWLPWNHTFGGNHNFTLVLRNGGVMYIDAGKPLPELIEQTIDNLREVSPTMYFNVPAGYSMLLPYLEDDKVLCEHFFRNLKLLMFAAAALPKDLWERLERLSVAVLGRKVPITSAWGTTETAPLATTAHFPIEDIANIGIPVPGVSVKMLPFGDKMELRVKGPNITPGYHRRPELTAKMFDEEGYYLAGDAGRLVDPLDPARGILFDGRITEDFKLMTGTWVSTGTVRVNAIAAASPLIRDAVVTGSNRADIGLLAWLNDAAGEQFLTGGGQPLSSPLILNPVIRARLVKDLAGYNTRNPGSSRCIRRIMLMSEPPEIDAGEITDKGYINQRAVQERRADLVERLYAESPDPEVILL